MCINSKTTTVRIDIETYENLKKLSEQLKQPMHKTIHEALLEYKKKILLSKTAEAFAALKRNTKLWDKEIEERRMWENTLQDGIN